MAGLLWSGAAQIETRAQSATARPDASPPHSRRTGRDGSGQAGLLQRLVGLDDVLELGLGAAVALVQVRVEALQELVIAGLDGRLVGAGIETEVAKGGAFQLADAQIILAVGAGLFLGATTEQAETVAP